MAKQARCHRCGVRWTWDRETPPWIPDPTGNSKALWMECPECPGIYLEQTTYLYRGPTRRLDTPPSHKPEHELKSGRRGR